MLHRQRRERNALKRCRRRILRRRLPIEALESRCLLSANLSHGVINADDDWQTVTLDESYNSMVVVATPNHDASSAPGVVRIRNAMGNSFEIRVDAAGPTAVDNMDVHYMVVEEGVYDTAGYKLEAVKYNSTVTDAKDSWLGQSRAYQQSYDAPVVVGQVMTRMPWSVT